MNRISEELDIASGVKPQDIGTADVTGAYIHMSGYRQALATVTTEDLTDGQTATVELLQATDSSGTGAKELKAAITGTATAEQLNVIAEVDVRDDEFDTNNDFAYFAVKVTCSEAGKLGSATVVLGDKRYSS